MIISIILKCISIIEVYKYSDIKKNKFLINNVNVIILYLQDIEYLNNFFFIINSFTTYPKLFIHKVTISINYILKCIMKSLYYGIH